METNLTPEQSSALRASSEHRLSVVDPSTNRRYVIVDADDLASLESIAAIRNGIVQMEQGIGQPLSDAMNDVRKELQRRI